MDPKNSSKSASDRGSIQNRYLVKSIVHASHILTAFQYEGEVLRLRDVVSRTGYSKMTCYRLLYSLHNCGFLEKAGANQYKATNLLRSKRKYRLGYAAHGQDASFPQEVGDGLARAAESAQVELIVVNNRYDARTALRNADQLIREEVDLVIEFQADEIMAPVIASKFMEAKIPLVAIDIPHPGATYFGANNYEAGLLGGRHLGRWANKNWQGDVDEILLVELSRAGSVPGSRIRGILAGINEVLQCAGQCEVVHADGDGQFGKTQEAIRKHLRTTRARRILVGASTDPSALGALRAFEEAGRAQDCAVAGQNGDPEGRAELREARTRFIGTVAYFPEKYGAGVLRLALDILARKATPPAVFTRHQLLTPENVDSLYPNDSLMSMRARTRA